jgi:hypothetical protein
MMEQTTLVHPSAFCWNPSCADYGKVDQGNIRRFGRTQAGTQRYQCHSCNGTFVETIGAGPRLPHTTYKCSLSTDALRFVVLYSACRRFSLMLPTVVASPVMALIRRRSSASSCC